jgi:rhodanese-related sulfurtransferase
VFTGDTLFVGDVARPDLAVEKEEGAAGIFRSLHQKLLTLPGHVEVWPAHLGGSLCGGPGMDMKVSSTIGFEQAHNPDLQIEDEAEFVRTAISRLGPQPPNFKAIVEINKGPLLRESIEAHPLAPRQVESARAEGALVVDVRTDLQFDEAHIPGSISNTRLRAGFGSKLAWLADREQPIVFVGRDDDDGHRATELAAAIGLTNVRGYLAGGMTSWREERRDTESIERITVDELHDRIDDLQVLDVREEAEWKDGVIPGSILVPYHDIHELPPELDPSRPVAVICSSGQRSAVAASMLQRLGAEKPLHVVDGGVGTWGRQGYPLLEPEPGVTKSSQSHPNV